MLETPHQHYLRTTSNGPAIRVGLLLESVHAVPAYGTKVIGDILESTFAQIALVMVQRNGGEVSSKRHFLYERYLRLDARMKKENDPLKTVDSGDLLGSVKIIEQNSEPGQQLPSDVAQELRASNLDVFVQFGSGSVSDEIVGAVRCGVWTLQPGDPEFYRGQPALFWEMRERNPTSGMTLQALTRNTSESLVLAKALFATEQTISVSRNRYIPYWGSADLILQKLHELHEFGWEHVVARAEPKLRYRGRQVQYEVPGNSQMINWLAPVLLQKAAAYPFRKPTVQHWRIALRRKRVPLFEANGDCAGFRWVDPPQGHAWADPFLFEHEGKCWIFFEDYSYAKKRGSIACAEISPTGELHSPMQCLEDPKCHYSYPHIFREEANIFMIPESFDANSVDLYRCTRFPDQWVREARLLEGRFVDSTMWQQDGLWWLMTTSADPVPGASSLWLYYSPSFSGEWKFHPQNPISRDIRNNRSAGRVFRENHRLIRTSQSGAPTYGYSITFHEITELSTKHYAERAIKTITPEHWKGMAGVHTYNCGADFEVMDGRMPRVVKELL